MVRSRAASQAFSSWLSAHLCNFLTAAIVVVLTSASAYAQDNPSSINNPDPEAFTQYGSYPINNPGPDVDIGTMISNYTAHRGSDFRLEPLDDNLMGESHDIDTGTISFRQVDVSLPGNFTLPVEFARVASGQTLMGEGVPYEGPLGRVWRIDLPYIAFRSGHTPIGHTRDDTFQFIIGLKLYIPGEGQTDLGQAIPNAPSGYSGSASRSMYVSNRSPEYRGSTFNVLSPNGTKYRFDRAYVRDSESSNTRMAQGLVYIDRYTLHTTFVYPTEVTDVHGNWVRYEYGAHGPTRIHASDGRVITIAYLSGKLDTVTANGRTWRYDHGSQGLSRVTLPDDRYWSFGYSEQGMGYNGMTDYDCLRKRRDQDLANLHMRHPSGTTAVFKTGVIHNFVGDVPNAGPSDGIPLGNAFADERTACAIEKVRTNWYMTRALLEKKLTTSDGSERVWSYDYDQGPIVFQQSCVAYRRTLYADVCIGVSKHYVLGPGSGNKHDRKRTVTNPAGEQAVYHINSDFLEDMWDGWKVGHVHKEEIFAAGSSTPIRVSTVDSMARMETLWGRAFVGNNVSTLFTVAPAQRTITQDGDTYTYNYSYQMDVTEPSYAGAMPVEVSVKSNVTTTPKTTRWSYWSDTARWIWKRHHVKTINDREHLRIDYGTSSAEAGKMVSVEKFGHPYATFGYHTATGQKGSTAWVEDALGRRTRFERWKRGKPRSVWRPDGIEKRLSVDDNGWVGASRDANGNLTHYGLDNMGRITQVNPPGTFSNTNIAYDFPATGGATQTITRGDARTTITYDSMYRPILEQVEAVDTGWQSFTKTAYDEMGRVAFTSFPSDTSNPTAGTETKYDALGRITLSEETVAPYARTRYSYLRSHRTRVTDALGDYVDTYRYGWDGPDAGHTRSIYRYGGQAGTEITSVVYNVHGELQRLVRHGGDSGMAKLIHRFQYDSQSRLCRERIPEEGNVLYGYDAAGQMTSYSKGHGDGSSCSTPQGAYKVTLGYDDLGRETLRDFTDPTAPDIATTYDNNGNILTLNRGTGSSAVNWTYTYNTVDALLSETLSLDGKNFPIEYEYNNDEHLVRRRLPDPGVANYWLDHDVDGLGRPLEISHGNRRFAHTVSYHPNGVPSRVNHGTGMRTDRFLNSRQQIRQIKAISNSLRAVDLTYSYDANGRITGILDKAVTGHDRTFGYDGIGQLTDATGPWGTFSATYDMRNNLVSRTLSNFNGRARTIATTYDSRNRASRVADSLTVSLGGTGSRTIDYDSRGNVTTLGTLGFTYAADDRPRAVSGGVTGNYRYDGHGRRVKSTVGGKTIYNVYNRAGKLVHIDETNNNVKTTYISGPDGGPLAKVRNGKAVFLHADHLGSAVAATTDTGTLAWREYYTPFGLPLEQPSQIEDQAGFTGHIRDSATDLNYMQARYYDPVMGRMISRDPVTFLVAADPRYMNRYSYGVNDPINFIDPSGMFVCQNDGIEQDCAPEITEAYDLLKSVQGTGSEEENKAIEEALDWLGEEGEENGVIIEIVRDSESPGAGHFIRDGNGGGTIALTQSAVSGKSEFLAGTIGHEATHGVFASKYPWKDYHMLGETYRIGTELAAYQVSAHMIRVLQPHIKGGPNSLVHNGRTNIRSVWMAAHASRDAADRFRATTK